MGDPQQTAAKPSDATIYCPHCGQVMLVRPQHLQVPVACPRCSQTVEPWRVVGATEPGAASPVSPQQYDHPRQGVGGYSWRNRWLAGILGILLGVFGVHRFYLGYIKLGILQCALTVGSFFALSWVVFIWASVEGILCLCGAMRDADGLPLRG